MAPDDFLYLRARPIYLDDLRLFDEAEGYAPRPPIGDRHPFAAQDEPATVYVQRLRAGTEARDLWVRLDTTSTRFIYLEVLDGQTLRQSNMRLQTLGAIFITLVAVFLLVGLYQSIFQRDALSWAFTFNQAVALMHGAITYGFGRWLAEGWLPQVAVDRAFSVLVLCYIFSIVLFSNFLLREVAPSRLRNVVFGGFCLLYITLIGLQFVGMLELSLTLNRYIVLTVPLLFFLDAIRLPSARSQSANTMGLTKGPVVFYFTFTMLFAYLWSLPTMGWIPVLEFTLYSGTVYRLSAGTFMLGMLLYRSRFLMRQRERLINDARVANQRAELEHAKRMERERLIAMLGHELNTPLATLRMMLGDQRVPRQVAEQLNQPLRDINALVERTVQTGQLENDAIVIRPEHSALIEAVKQAGKYAEGERFVWAVHPSVEQLEVEIDAFLLGVIVRNLLDNAVKYSPEHSDINIHLRADRREKKWTLEVCNRVGRAGFPDPQKVFDKFYRSPLASFRSGSGQGLFIALRLAELMGGTLQYRPSDDAVSFRLIVPFQAPVISGDHR